MDEIQTLCAIFGVFVAIASFFVGFFQYAKSRYKKRKTSKRTYYISRGVFVDRIKSIEEFDKYVENNSRIVNIYGHRGIGKSAFLRFLCDCVNDNLNKQNKNNRRNLKKINGYAFYIELSSYGDKTIEEQLLKHCGYDSFEQFTSEMLKNAKFKRKVYIFLDNINTKALCNQIENVIDALWLTSNKFHVILGSIEKQQLLKLHDEIDYIKLDKFTEKDIFDFANKNNGTIENYDMNKILNFTKGLPIFVSFLIQNQSNIIDFNSERIEKYIEQIMEELSENQNQLAKYIAFLSITNSIIELDLLRKFSVNIALADLEALERSSLIEYEFNSHVKMHETFRNYIVKRYSYLRDIVFEIFQYYEKQDLLFEQTYYLIMLDDKNNTNIIVNAIEKAVNNDSYPFLILLGEHYKLMNDWSINESKFSSESFLTLLYGYVYALMGIGNYPAARDIIDECKISSRNIDKIIEFRFSLLTASLYHLQNKYDISIETYHMLLSSTSQVFLSDYESKCLWGIAHSLRHKGYDLDSAVVYYNNSIEIAEKNFSNSEVINGMLEKLMIFLLREDKVQSDILFHDISERMTKLSCIDNSETNLNFITLKARYNRIINNSTSTNELNELNLVLNEYSKQQKRLIYNVYFEIGEYFRRCNAFDNAIESYKKAYAFSKQNHDYNLKTLSSLAISLCEISCNIDISEEIISTLAQTIVECKEHDLYINKLLSELTLNIVKDYKIDNQIMIELNRLKYKSAIKVYGLHNKKFINEINLFLM